MMTTKPLNSQDITAAELIDGIETRGASAMTSSSRESLVYATEGLRGDLPFLLESIAKTALTPVFIDEDFELARTLLEYAIQDHALNAESYLDERLHQLAYGDGALAIPLVPTQQQIMNITPEKLQQFHQRFFVPNNMIVAATGYPHQQFVDAVTKLFGHLKPGNAAVYVPSSYVGGYSFVEDLRDPPLKPRADEAHTIIALPSVPMVGERGDIPDGFYTGCVLQSLMGGGSSFSSGGPGKGMYSRLYRQVLNAYPWIENTLCLNYAYPHEALMLIRCIADKSRLYEMLDITAAMFIGMRSVSTEELDRARNHVKASLMTGLEARLPLLEDLLFSNHLYNRQATASEHIERLDAITRQDITNFVDRMFQAPPTVIAHGAAGSDSVWGGETVVDQLHQIFVHETTQPPQSQ
jgi:mitochondrial-processing peptidase subunit alpha